MRLQCHKCDNEVDIIVLMSGPHLKAICPDCKGYIKFLNKTEKLKFQGEEDRNENIN